MLVVLVNGYYMFVNCDYKLNNSIIRILADKHIHPYTEGLLNADDIVYVTSKNRLLYKEGNIFFDKITGKKVNEPIIEKFFKYSDFVMCFNNIRSTEQKILKVYQSFGNIISRDTEGKLHLENYYGEKNLNDYDLFKWIHRKDKIFI